MVLTLGAVVWRVYDVQQVYGAKLTKNSDAIVDVTKPLLAARGSILDAEGDQLAYDIPAYYVDIDAEYIGPYAASAASILAPILGSKASDLQQLLSNNKTWIQLPTPVQEPVMEKLQQAFAAHQWQPGKSDKITWSNQITFTPTEQREYPYGEFAANTIGYVSKGTGQSGVELEYNKLLGGTNGEMTYKQDPTGVPLPGTVKVTKPSKPGDTVQLTINDAIQGYVENQMNTLINQYHPEHAAIIVSNPQTGAILAISSRPSFDPNQYQKASLTALSQNWAVSSAFEPGSTFKPFVMSAALATNSINMYSTFQSGQVTVDGQTIHDWLWGGWGTLTYQEALEKSSNVGFTKIALALGWPNMNKYLNLFGFTQPTGIDLPNEATSLLFPKSDQHQIQLATSGFGQGIAVTPLQQVAALGAIANGGKLMRPYITQKIISPSGKVIKQTTPHVVRQGFLPESVIQEVSHTMVLDVSGSQGIDTIAAIKGYEVAGKTGTAQIVNPATGQYYNNRFETSFIGYAPANDPKVLVYVTVYWPKTAPDEQWGSTVAAPPARNIIQDCLNYYHIPPTGAVTSVSQTSPGAGTVKYVDTPNIVGMTQAAAESKLSEMGLKLTIAGTSGVVQRQWPAVGIEVPSGSTMYGLLQTRSGKSITVPNLQGMSLRDATNLLAALGLTIDPTGSGFVKSQTVTEGTAVTSGSTVGVTLQP